jgi:hypothetical protein
MMFLRDERKPRDVSCSCSEGGVTEQCDDGMNLLREHNRFAHSKTGRYEVVSGQLPRSLDRLPSPASLSDMGWLNPQEADQNFLTYAPFSRPCETDESQRGRGSTGVQAQQDNSRVAQTAAPGDVALSEFLRFGYEVERQSGS